MLRPGTVDLSALDQYNAGDGRPFEKGAEVLSSDDWSAPERAAGLPPVQMGLLGRAIETSRHAVFVSSHAGDLILAVNQAACELLGYTRDELLQGPPSAFTARGEAELRGVYEELQSPGATIRAEAQLKRKDGALVTIGYWGSWVQVTGVDYLLTITDPIDSALQGSG